MSHEALSPQQFMYHRSPKENRRSIKKLGLLASKPSWVQTFDAPHGVYLNPAPNEVHGFDIWKVRTEGLQLHDDPDPIHASEGAGMKYHPADIPSERVRLVPRERKQNTA